MNCEINHHRVDFFLLSRNEINFFEVEEEKKKERGKIDKNFCVPL
jgi:hypothetical protein